MDDTLDEVVIGTTFEDSGKSQSPLHDENMDFQSPQKDSPVKSNF